MKQIYKIMLVVGEPSGDAHAAKLVKALREIAPDTEFEFFGTTGQFLREAGVETILKADDLSVVGLIEIGKVLPMFLNARKTLKNEAKKRNPDAVILVDFPEFNLKLAKSLKKQDLKTIYYISPQLWAWRSYRMRTIRKYIDLLITILPFEKDWYARQGIHHVEYVGNPLAREVHSELTREQFCGKHKLNAAKPIISLLAGSRHKEIAAILPVLLETACLLEKNDAEIQFIIPLAATRKPEEVETAKKAIRKKGLKLPANLLVVKNETREALHASDAAAVTSGTATLETAILGTPMAIVYKTSPLNYKLLRPLISVEHFGLINLIAGERLAKELIQDEFTPENLAAELENLLAPEVNRTMRERLLEVTEKLGHGGASRRAAEHILKLLEIRGKKN